MRHLIACCDGTWNTPAQEAVSNVRRIHNALVEDAEQVRYYHPGVGTDGGLLNWLLGGVTGAGLSRNVMHAYHWLTTTYRPGDHIALFGFSRGAYTVRSLAGMVSACGLFDTTGLDEPAIWRRVEQVYHRRYRPRPRHDPDWRDGLSFTFDPEVPDRMPITFVGVWETVGALGIPDYAGLVNLLDSRHRYDFHDLTLNPHIRHARHAVALDENRSAFTPSLWSDPPADAVPEQQVKQVWFPGSHLDIGGCYPQRGLGDGPLLWMIDEARDATDRTGRRLEFRKETLDQIGPPDPFDVQHDDNLGASGLLGVAAPVLGPWLQAVFPTRPRTIPLIDPAADAGCDDVVHRSGYERQRTVPITHGPYLPTRVLEVGETATVTVHAREPWNWTGLYLPAGSYAFVARGQWRDAGIWSGPGGITGADSWPPGSAGHLTAALIELAQRLFRRWSGNEEAEFLGCRRADDLPWMALVGVVANQPRRGEAAHGEHERIAIGAGTEHRVRRDGYLHAFANDAWCFYSNNQGSVRVTVTRTA